MSGFGEAIACELVAQLVLKTARLGFHIIRNTGKYAEDAQRYQLRLEVQVNIIQAINEKFQDEQFLEHVRPAALDTFGKVMKEIHRLFQKYINCNCRDGLEKQEIFKVTSIDDVLMTLDAKENLSEKEKERNLGFLLKLRNEAAWGVFKKDRTEKWVSEIEFWGQRLDKFTSWVVPGMFPHATSLEIQNHIGDPRLAATNVKSRILIARRTTNNSVNSFNSTNSVNSATTANSIQLMDIDDPVYDRPLALDSRRIKLYNEGYVRSPSPDPRQIPMDGGFDCAKRSDLGGVDRRQWAEYTDLDGNSVPVIVEFKPHITQDDFRFNFPIRAITDEIDKLIKTLRIAGKKPNTFHVLDCEGWYQTYNHFGLVYRLPPHPQKFRCESLGNILLKPEYKEQLQRDLDNRLQLAKALAWTLFELHTVDWVHQSFNPDNILLFGEEVSEGAVKFDWSSPYLVGFDSSRSNSGVSGKLNFRGEWTSRLYTHPDRLLKDYERYKKIHDIYSLGVVLLEVGRLGSFLEDRQISEWNRHGPHTLKDIFTKKARGLQPVLGKSYAEAVVACLVGLFDDRDDYTFMGEFRSQVCEKLDQIRIS